MVSFWLDLAPVMYKAYVTAVFKAFFVLSIEAHLQVHPSKNVVLSFRLNYNYQ